MSIAISEEHSALAASARRFLEQKCPPRVGRAGLDVERESLPPFWSELAALGWVGIHLPDSSGGEGFGIPELAVVVEEMGRAAAPGPFLPAVIAAAVVATGGPLEVVEALSKGDQIATIAFPATSTLEGSDPAGDAAIVVTGLSRPVLEASVADWLVLPAVGADGERWCLIPATDAEITELPSLDPTRRVSSVAIERARVPITHQLPVDRRAVEDLIAVLVAAECAGGAGWCVDVASEYAKVREQFGRPIGQFQGVKHRCANMLVATEQARAAAWDAAGALGAESSDGAAGEAALSAAVAGAVAPDSYVRVAEDCIQVLGGIGFTWEHDAHRYLRRSVSLRQLMGGTEPWRARLAELATGGARRSLHVELPPDAEEIRARIRTEAEAIAALAPDGQRAALVDAGLFVPHWPEPLGRAASPAEQLVIDEELRRLKLRRPNLAVGAWAAPTIATHGSPQQAERWVRPTLLGEITWCQLFSEPGAGSDLASLSTKAVKTQGGWLISGQKVWTSMANGADWGICLARTDPSAAKHLGITYFVVDMKSPGIEVRPLRELTGMAMFNEVFLNDVFVADDCVIGEVNGGWPLARTTLANERVAMGSGASFGGGIEALLRLVGDNPLGEAKRDHLGALVADAYTVALLGQRATLRAVAGGPPGPESSVRKLLSAEVDQRVQEFGLGLLGGEGATVEGAAAQWSFGFLANRCLTIAGGTSEVQRNVIAERLLGLPRDPEPPAGRSR